MTLSTAELVAALGETPVTEASAGEALQALVAKITSGPVPTGAITRLWSLGSLQTRIALGYLAYWIRSGFRDADENERRLNETHLQAAIQLLGTMSYLRGIFTKVGQLFATYPHALPKEYIEVLGQLHFDAPPMHYSLLREFVRNELGAEPEEVFAEFETEAFAAASLGQVHRGRLKSGEVVAIKVQYPNIARTIQTDFRNFMALVTPMRLTKAWSNLRVQWDDMRQMFEWETDYVREADFLRRGRAVFGEDEGIVVPRVYEEYSTRRVLTMEYLDGVHLDRYLTTKPSQEERDCFGRLIILASFRLPNAARLWYADSNPGNYLFLRDGRLGVLDFGCCREFSPEEWDYYTEIFRAHREGGERLRQACIRGAALDPNEPYDERQVQLIMDFMHWNSDYVLHEGPFDFGDEAYIRRGIELSTAAFRNRYLSSQPVNTWINRQLIGLKALAYKLGARIDMKTLCEQEAKDILQGESNV